MRNSKLKIIDAVYPLGSGSRWEDDELRYSIRSMEKYYPNLGDVYVIGEKPAWYRGKHIPFEEKWKRTENVFRKQRLISSMPGLSENYVWMNDDIFLLEPVEHKHYTFKTVADKWPVKPGNGYWEYIQSKLEWKNFCTHSPFIVNKHDWMEIMKGVDLVLGFSPMDYYGNKSTLWERVELPGDSKFRDQTLPELKDFIKGRSFFSAHSGMKRKVFVPFLEGLYLEKSNFEL